MTSDEALVAQRWILVHNGSNFVEIELLNHLKFILVERQVIVEFGGGCQTFSS